MNQDDGNGCVAMMVEFVGDYMGESLIEYRNGEESWEEVGKRIRGRIEKKIKGDFDKNGDLLTHYAKNCGYKSWIAWFLDQGDVDRINRGVDNTDSRGSGSGDGLGVPGWMDSESDDD